MIIPTAFIAFLQVRCRLKSRRAHGFSICRPIFWRVEFTLGAKTIGDSASGTDCVVIETPRRTMNKPLSSVASAKRVLDETFILRTIQSRFAPSASIEDLLPIAQHAELHEFRPGEALFLEGDEADSLHLVRSGSVAV